MAQRGQRRLTGISAYDSSPQGKEDPIYRSVGSESPGLLVEDLKNARRYPEPLKTRWINWDVI